MTYMSIGKWEVQEKAFCSEYQEYEVTDKSREDCSCETVE